MLLCHYVLGARAGTAACQALKAPRRCDPAGSEHARKEKDSAAAAFLSSLPARSPHPPARQAPDRTSPSPAGREREKADAGLPGWGGRRGQGREREDEPAQSCRLAILVLSRKHLPDGQVFAGQGSFSNDFQSPALRCSISGVFCKHQRIRDNMTLPLSRDNGQNEGVHLEGGGRTGVFKSKLASFCWQQGIPARQRAPHPDVYFPQLCREPRCWEH